MRSHGYTLTNGATTMSRANAQTIDTGGGIGPAGLKDNTHQKANHDLPLRGHKTHDMAHKKGPFGPLSTRHSLVQPTLPSRQARALMTEKKNTLSGWCESGAYHPTYN